MEIEHTLDGTQVDYGYFWWKSRENDKYQQIFPEGPFTLDLEGRKLSGKKVDWAQGRVSIGKKPLQELFQKDDVIIISKSSDGKTVVVRKKENRNKPIHPISDELPLVRKLRVSQRDSTNPILFEKALVEAFQYLGLSAVHIGGRDEPDIFIDDNFNIIIDSKTTKEGVITERYINFDALERYKDDEKYNANHIGIVAPGFSEGYIKETAKKRGVVLIETEAICTLLNHSSVYPYDQARIIEILFRADKDVITPNDIPTSTVDQEKLIQIIAKIMSDIKLTGKRSFTSDELQIAYQWQGLNYEIDEIENALRFLSTTPFVILRNEDRKYILTDELNIILRKIGLLLQAFNKLTLT